MGCREGSIIVDLLLMFKYPPGINVSIEQQQVTSLLIAALPVKNEDSVILKGMLTSSSCLTLAKLVFYRVLHFNHIAHIAVCIRIKES